MIESRDGRRVVITGVGVVASCGIGAGEFWQGLAKPPEPRAERHVEGFDPFAIGLSKVEVRRLDLFSQFAMTASDEALRDAGMTDPQPDARPDRRADRQRHRGRRRRGRRRFSRCATRDSGQYRR